MKFKLITSFCLLSVCFFFHFDALALEVCAVGDVSISQRLIESREEDLQKIRLTGDIVFANFEGVLSNKHTRDDTIHMKLTMPPSAGDALMKLGFNALSLANNHALDLGLQSYRETLSGLSKKGFAVAGLDDSGKAIAADGAKIRFIAFSFSGLNDVNDLIKTASMIRAFKEDIIIVSAHMGEEGRNVHTIPNRTEMYDDKKERRRYHVCTYLHRRGCRTSFSDIVLTSSEALKFTRIS